MAELELSQDLAARTLPRLAMRPSAVLVAATELLALSWAALEQAVERELANSPALERAEAASCGLCSGPLINGRCPECHRPRGLVRSSAGAVETRTQPAAQPSLAETLLAELAPELTPRDRPIAEYLLDSLDDRGLLDATVEGVAAALAVGPLAVARVLALIQATGPPGLAARDLRECLLLQLDRRGERTRPARLARLIVDRHLKALGQGQYGKIAAALGVDPADVVAALEFIRAHLAPDPTVGLAPATQPPPLAPDIAIRETGDGLAVEVLERERLQLVVSPIYEQALATPRPADERDAIRRELLAARAFIERLEQRWRTMLRVAEVAVGRQRAFILNGRAPVALTRAEVAHELGVHESTVSRAVAGRSLLLPSGRVVAFARLFGRSHAPQEALAQLVAAETRPKSDAVLARELSGLGYVLARRTVAKYREQLGIQPSSLRPSAKPASHLTSV